MIDFSAPTNLMYDMWGVEATHYTDDTDAGTPCTILYDRQGEESTEYGVVDTSRITVRKTEIADPKRGQKFYVDDRAWQIEFILPASEGTNELETALACTEVTHFGRTG